MYAVSYVGCNNSNTLSNSNNSPFVISNYSSSTQFTFFLPNYNYATVYVSIKDAYDCITNVSTVVRLAEPSLAQAFSSTISYAQSAIANNSLGLLIEQVAALDNTLTCG